MLYRFMTAGAAACALTLLGFPGQADVTTRLMLKASPALTILAADEENSEVENLLDPEADNGVPAPPRQRQATAQGRQVAFLLLRRRPKGDGAYAASASPSSRNISGVTGLGSAKRSPSARSTP